MSFSHWDVAEAAADKEREDKLREELGGDTTQLEADLTAAQATIVTLQGEVSTLQTNMTDALARITALEAV